MTPDKIRKFNIICQETKNILNLKTMGKQYLVEAKGFCYKWSPLDSDVFISGVLIPA